MATVTLTLEEYEALRDMAMGRVPLVEAIPEVKPKKKRKKVSKYSKAFGIQLKLLKKKHPRTKISALMSKAHRATKKVMK